MKFITICNRLYLKGIWCLVLYLSVAQSLECQAKNTIGFKIDMSKTIQCGLFSPSENDTVIIRGSFNKWTGNDYVLVDVNKDEIYEQTFNIDSDSGIIHEYKYLIIKSNGTELWEKCPNKNNMPYGNRFLDSTMSKPDNFDFDKYHMGIIGKDVIFSIKETKDDFNQFRNTLEGQHCCLYEYTSKEEFDSLFDSQYQLLTKQMSPNEFFKVLTPITAKIGCGHTAVWMPAAFWDYGKKNLFPLKIRLIEDKTIVEGSYADSCEVKKGSIIQEINGVSISDIIHEIQINYSADAMNIHFINSQIERRFPLIFARRFGFKDNFQIKYLPPDKKISETKVLSPASNSSVRAIVFRNFDNPPLQMEIVDERTALMKISTFIYYDKVTYFTNFIDSCFAVINGKSINNLILDLRGNDGGDPFCAAPLFSYLQKKPEPYFAEPYGKYSELAKPIPLPKNHYTGNLFTIMDGRCFSTNAHFCSLLKYHNIGKFVGTESGATYICNAGKNGIETLQNTEIQLYFGRSSFATAVKGMDKSKPIIPDYYVKETLADLLDGRDVMKEFIFDLIKN